MPATDGKGTCRPSSYQPSCDRALPNKETAKQGTIEGVPLCLFHESTTHSHSHSCSHSHSHTLPPPIPHPYPSDETDTSAGGPRATSAVPHPVIPAPPEEAGNGGLSVRRHMSQSPDTFGAVASPLPSLLLSSLPSLLHDDGTVWTQSVGRDASASSRSDLLVRPAKTRGPDRRPGIRIGGGDQGSGSAGAYRRDEDSRSADQWDPDRRGPDQRDPDQWDPDHWDPDRRVLGSKCMGSSISVRLRWVGFGMMTKLELAAVNLGSRYHAGEILCRSRVAMDWDPTCAWVQIPDP